MENLLKEIRSTLYVPFAQCYIYVCDNNIYAGQISYWLPKTVRFGSVCRLFAQVYFCENGFPNWFGGAKWNRLLD